MRALLIQNGSNARIKAKYMRIKFWRYTKNPFDKTII